MMKMPKLMAAAGAALLALLIAGAALAQTTPGTPNHGFWGFGGDVTIDGEPATDKARIIAMADGAQVGSANYDPGTGWSIDVAGGTTGVTFMVMVKGDDGSDTEYATGETRDATPGGNTRLMLAATSAMTMPETEDDGGDLEGDGSGMMDGGDLEGDGTGMMDGGDLEGDGTGMMDGGDEDPPMDGGDLEGDDSGMMMGDDEDPPTVGDATGLPDNGTGGLADSSRGVSTAVYGGIAGALALIALVGGVAIRRRAQS